MSDIKTELGESGDISHQVAEIQNQYQKAKSSGLAWNMFSSGAVVSIRENKLPPPTPHTKERTVFTNSLEEVSNLLLQSEQGNKPNILARLLLAASAEDNRKAILLKQVITDMQGENIQVIHDKTDEGYRDPKNYGEYRVRRRLFNHDVTSLVKHGKRKLDTKDKVEIHLNNRGINDPAELAHEYAAVLLLREKRLKPTNFSYGYMLAWTDSIMKNFGQSKN